MKSCPRCGTDTSELLESLVNGPSCAMCLLEDIRENSCRMKELAEIVKEDSNTFADWMERKNEEDNA